MTGHRPTRVRTQIIFCAVVGFVLSWVVMVGLHAVPMREAMRYEQRDAKVEDLSWVRDGHFGGIDDVDVSHLLFGVHASRRQSELSIVFFRVKTIEANNWAVISCWSGWPMRQAMGTVRCYGPEFHPRTLKYDIRGLCVVDAGHIMPRPARRNDFTTLVVYSSTGPSPERVLPYRPIWTGLGINTAFYGAIFWFIWFAPRYVRRWIRVGDRRCIMCAYPTAPRTRCSECGTPATGVRWRRADL
jgi:hypothetical protein